MVDIMSFIDSNASNPPHQPPADSTDHSADDEPVRITLTGSRRAVKRAINDLHQLKYVRGSEWSRLIALQNSKEVIAVAIRRFFGHR
ncbi:hypothetical protein [Thermoleptolyngbya sp. C42_A2020_037]|uniref:hypothetical protein n=1 Tax=Thermoleptolyngbya sp. C42_A2020_037 TaxID=2747799 RepID=UPI0019E6B41C|nr:hypothetical protein [Thermoleptolyngbya sp. C42_A2020_037]MBF2086291.1 hypothetical protein [Thermoleptolyngbya sp. C42_A2020_037]